MGRVALSAVIAVPLLICAVWTVFAGKDLNWDLLNYHYYLPYELLGDRLRQDFFAASAQSYLNPVGYLPFYLMVSAGWHSVIVSIVLAAAHGLSISLLFLLAWRSFAHLAGRDRMVFPCLATALGSATAVFWPTVGTSFLDPLLVPPMLGGLLLLCGGEHDARKASIAGALFGAAAALKYSNAIFVIAALPLALAISGAPIGVRLRAGLGYAGGAGAAIAVLAGPWLWVLWREFGNPVFPLFNAWFKSPDAFPVNLVNARFAPADWVALLHFPFQLISLDRALYLENFAPDLRLAGLMVVATALFGRALWHRPAKGGLQPTDRRIAGFLAVGYVLWLLSSANGRYGIVLLLLAGLCLARLTEQLLSATAARIALGVFLAVQVAIQATASPPRWFIAAPWSAHWLDYDVSERARREPALYLTVEVLPMAVVIPFLHPGSSFVNLRGQHSLPPDAPRLRKLLERHEGRVRALGRGLELADGRPSDRQVRVYDTTLVRAGFRLDTTDCFAIAWRSDREDWLSRAANWLSRPDELHESLSVVSCALRPAPRAEADAEYERRISALFDRVENACPRWFRGQTAVTEPLGVGWSRNYAGLDVRLEADAHRVMLNLYRRGTFIDLGPRSSWEGNTGFVPRACSERPG